MKVDALDLLLSKNFQFNKKLYLISGNEKTLMEKIYEIIIKNYKKKENILVTAVDNIEGYVSETGLFEDKKIYLGKNCKGIDQKNLDKIKNTNDIFIFMQENSQKTKKIKDLFAKDKNSYLVDCYELDKTSKIKILNKYLELSESKIDKDIYWFLVDRLDNRFVFLENSLIKIFSLEQKDLTLINIKKILTDDDSGKEKLFFNLLKKNSQIVRMYREKITTVSDVGDLFYYCRFLCHLIIDSKDKDDTLKNSSVFI